MTRQVEGFDRMVEPFRTELLAYCYRMRARARMKEVGIRQEPLSEPSAAEQRAWVDRYMTAFEHADVEGLKRLLSDEYQLHTVQIFTVTAEGISRNSVFQESEVFATFGLTARLDAQTRMRCAPRTLE